jgi:zinc finger protein
MDKLENQPCPICRAQKLTLIEDEIEVPYFGKAFLFSMHCEACEFHKGDVEFAEEKDPARYTLEISSPSDMNIRVVKGSNATVKLPDLRVSIEPGADADGYVANVEKILNDLLEKTKEIKETEEDSAKRKKAWKLMDKILDIKEGKEKTTLILEDPTGNSSIISEKAIKEAIKPKKEKKAKE